MWPHGCADVSVVLKDSVRASSVMPSFRASQCAGLCVCSFLVTADLDLRHYQVMKGASATASQDLAQGRGALRGRD